MTQKPPTRVPLQEGLQKGLLKPMGQDHSGAIKPTANSQQAKPAAPPPKPAPPPQNKK